MPRSVANITKISPRWVNGMIEFYDSVNFQTVDVMAPIKKFDHFTGPAVDSTNDWTVAGVNGGTAAINVAVGGHLRITTGGADADDVDVASEIIWEASKNCVCEARIAQNDADGTAFCFGFTDAKGEAADTLPIMYSGSTLASAASDCAMWFQDPNATTDLYRCVAVKANTDGTVTAVPAATATPADGTFHIFRVEINSDGDCSFWMDGVHYATESTGITTTTDLCVYVGLINRETAVNTADVDFINAWQAL